MVRILRLIGLALLLALVPASAAMPRYAHIFVVIEENHTADQILGNPAAPNINRLARQYGQASNYYAIRHPSEPNYIALLGGDTFGIADDDAYYCRPHLRKAGCEKSANPGYVAHSVSAPSLLDQLSARRLSWKGYFQGIPTPGSPVFRWPADTAAGDSQALYAVKHNAFMTFRRVQADPGRAGKIVGFDALDRDIAAGTLPAFAEIVPDQCHDMHGVVGCRDEAALVADADRLVGRLVGKITGTAMWNGPDNSAIVITFDEDGGDSATHPNGCCGSGPGNRHSPGGGWIATVVVTNHGPRGLTDPTPYNHYSLLRTIEDGFGIGRHLGHAADTDKGVVAMTPLFAVGRN
jgi:phosphatidylinositol-3-phosphatase